MDTPVEQRPVADWTDQDLLTRDEAEEKLHAEIAAEQQRLATLDPTDTVAREPLVRRLAALRQVLEQLRGQRRATTYPRENRGLEDQENSS